MISSAHQQCGHIMMFCTNCLATGCDVHRCDNSIGNGNSSICKYCGARATVTNFRRNELAKKRKFEGINHDQDVEHRLKALEHATNITFQTHSRRSVNTQGHGSVYHRPKTSLMTWVIFFSVCWVISKAVDYKQFDGLLGFVLGLVNICGAIAEIPIVIIKEIIF